MSVSVPSTTPGIPPLLLPASSVMSELSETYSDMENIAIQNRHSNNDKNL